MLAESRNSAYRSVSSSLAIYSLFLCYYIMTSEKITVCSVLKSHFETLEFNSVSRRSGKKCVHCKTTIPGSAATNDSMTTHLESCTDISKEEKELALETIKCLKQIQIEETVRIEELISTPTNNEDDILDIVPVNHRGLPDALIAYASDELVLWIFTASL